MRNFLKESVIIMLQLIVFYILPLFAGPTDTMGLVVLILFSTFILSIILGSISKIKYKYIYSIIVSVLFIPSIFIYYNSSALIHAFWYFVDSIIGIIIGSIFSKIKK